MKIKEVLKLVDIYIRKYRANDLEEFEIGEKYFLFPDKTFKPIYSWPDKWQFCGESGVYIFIDNNEEVIYIGQATHFGKRLGHYFSSKIDNLLKHKWKSNPYYIIQIKVPQESNFERLGLEEFLIKNSNPIDNKRFNY